MPADDVRRTWFLGALMALNLFAFRLPADDTPAVVPIDDPLIEEVSNLAKIVQRHCQFVTDGRDRIQLVPHGEPVLRWSNPTTGRVFGNVSVWTDMGRPLVVASIYKSPTWGATLEVCSLAEDKVTGHFGANQYWTPNAAGLQRRPLPSAEKPGSSAAVRLVQMRRLAAEFGVRLEDTRGTDRGVARQLRILTKPIFRYSPPTMADSKATYLDGALFAFVEGTDPEVLLVLEAIHVAGSVQWEYGLARMNRDALSVTFRETSVWSVPYLTNQLIVKTAPYTFFSLDQPPLNQLLTKADVD